jgi:hypothetical protein
LSFSVFESSPVFPISIFSLGIDDVVDVSTVLPEIVKRKIQSI